MKEIELFTSRGQEQELLEKYIIHGVDKSPSHILEAGCGKR